MNPVQMALVGCGGMGRRHLRGIAHLDRSLAVAGLAPALHLSVVIDDEIERAETLAEEAQHLLGYRPIATNDFESVLKDDSCSAVDICTGTESHHLLAGAALEAGHDVIVEKPLTSTTRTARTLVDTAKRVGRVLAVAENVRREPVNRFAHAVIQSGIIGDARMVLDVTLAGGDAIQLTPWRHRRTTGGILLDVGVHNADVLEYLVGRVDTVSGQVRLEEATRYRKPSSVASRSFYDSWQSQLPPRVEADAEDVGIAMLQFESGALGQWTINQAAHGHPLTLRMVLGSKGAIELPADRSGHPPVVVTETGARISGEELGSLLSGYALDTTEAAIWGASAPAYSGGTFEEIDRALVAIELHDFARSVQQGSSPEVDGELGLRNMALVYAVFESSQLSRPVSVQSVMDGSISSYQDGVDRELGVRVLGARIL